MIATNVDKPRVRPTLKVEAIRVLLVEDSPADAELVKRLLGKSLSPCIDVAVVEKLTAAIPLAAAGCHEVILLDLSLTDAQGLEGLRELVAAVPHTPILILSGLDDESTALEAISHGAQDYLVKRWDDSGQLRRAICHAIKRKAFEADLAQRAHFDRLTGVANRALFDERLAHALARARRTGDQVALMFIDLDGFKAVNDTLGHEIGDEVLRLAADRVRRCARDNETVARLGGDEFAVLLDPLLDETKPTAAAERILAVFREPLTVAGRAVQVTLSIGVAVFPDNASDADALLRCADAAMFRAKSLGRNTSQLYVSHDQPFGTQFVLDARANRH